MKHRLICIIFICPLLASISGCDNSKRDYVYVTDKQKEERLYLECLKAIKVDVKAGSDGNADAITECWSNASSMASDMIPRSKK